MKYQLHPKKALITFFLALSYLDLIFSNCTFTHDFSPELIGLMSLIIAGNF